MKKLTLFLSYVLLCNFSFAQNNNGLIVQFKVNEKPKSSKVLKLQKFNNPEIRSLNKSNKIKSIKLTGNKKKKDTYILALDSSKSVKELIEDYKKTGLFKYVEPNYVGSGHGFQNTPNDTYFNIWSWRQ